MKMRGKKIFTLLVVGLVFFLPAKAEAYLDPGTGNLLVYLLVSIFGTAIYCMRNVLYKILRFKTAKGNAAIGHENLVIFSEGKNYWLTFKPIVEGLIQKSFSFTYLSMDYDDPGLTIESPYMKSRYIGSGSAAFARVGNSRAALMLSTTPNIGTPGFPLPRPKHVRCLVHVLHAVSDICTYHKYSLDNYDTVMLMGDFMLESIRHLEKVRRLPAKECVSAGVPYIDEMLKNIHKKEGRSTPPVILIAPTWGEKGLLAVCGADFMENLAVAGYTVIVRPQPQSLNAEPEKKQKIQARLDKFETLVFDFQPDGRDALKRADLLISDMSGVRFDFALLYGRPVITVDLPLKNYDLYEVSDMETFFERDMSGEIGLVIQPGDVADIVSLVDKCLSKPIQDLLDFQKRYLANFGVAGPFIADWLVKKIQGLEADASRQ
jgi:hypothetical protein